MLFYFLSSLFSLCVCESVLKSIDPNTVLVLFATRNSQILSEEYLLKEPRPYQTTESSQLTKAGRVQAITFGRTLGKFLSEDFVSSHYVPSEVKYYTSSPSRSQMTLQSVLYGLHRDSELGVEEYNPVPYSINDALLRMFALEDCPYSEKAWKPILDETWKPMKTLKEKKAVILDYISKKSGHPGTLAVAAHLVDNIKELTSHNIPLPKWIETPELAHHNKSQLLAEMDIFDDYPHKACTQYAPCRGLMGGYWLKHLFTSIREIQQGKGQKLIGYSSNLETTLSTMKLAGYVLEDLPNGAGFIIEYKNKPVPSVRLLYHEPKGKEQVIYKAKIDAQLKRDADKDGFIPFNKFERLIGSNRIDDWKSACGREGSECNLPAVHPALAEFIGPQPITSTPSDVSSEMDDSSCEETDDAGSWRCEAWADYGYCASHRATKYLHCRRTCLCNNKYKHH